MLVWDIYGVVNEYVFDLLDGTLSLDGGVERSPVTFIPINCVARRGLLRLWRLHVGKIAKEETLVPLAIVIGAVLRVASSSNAVRCVGRAIRPQLSHHHRAWHMGAGMLSSSCMYVVHMLLYFWNCLRRVAQSMLAFIFHLSFLICPQVGTM